MTSRWATMKEQAGWHFDVDSKKSDYYEVCTFIGDWSKEQQYCDHKSSIRDLVNFPQDNTDWQQDLIALGADPTVPERKEFEVQSDLFKIFNRMASHLQVENPNIMYTNQQLGQQVTLHFDKGNLESKDTKRRFLIMLDDWKYGQVVLMGNSAWVNWRKGQCITWNSEVPHATANLGYESRPMLIVTGTAKSTMQKFLSESSYERLLKV